jgi:uncharacterized OB-fold protein
VTSGYGEAVLDPELATLPLPGWSKLTEPFWRESARGRLCVQQCRSCTAQFFPPSTVCYHCHSDDLEWTATSGTGTVFSFTWADYPPPSDGVERNIVVVELDSMLGPDPVRMLSWVADTTRDELRIGLAVEATFLPLNEDVAVPAWRVRRVRETGTRRFASIASVPLRKPPRPTR